MGISVCYSVAVLECYELVITTIPDNVSMEQISC